MVDKWIVERCGCGTYAEYPRYVPTEIGTLANGEPMMLSVARCLDCWEKFSKSIADAFEQGGNANG